MAFKIDLLIYLFIDLRFIVILLHSSAAKLNTLPYWSLLHSSESGPGQENDKTRRRIKSNTSETGEYFSTAVTQPWNLSNSLCTTADFHCASGPRPSTFTRRQRVVIMLYRKVLRAGRNYEVRITLDKKIIACQHRLSGLATKLIITVRECWSREARKTRQAIGSAVPDY